MPNPPLTRRQGLLAALGLFVWALVYLLLLGSVLQVLLGMPGLLLSELLLLVLAFSPVYLCGQPVGRVLPFRAPTLRQGFGALLLWAGAYPAVLLVTVLLACLFPQQVMGVSDGLTGFFAQVPLWAQLVVVALAPACCEELLFRGAMQFHLGVLRRPWLRVALVGVLFGLLHMDPVRLLPTALLGVALAWARERTGSLVYPMLMHCVHNALSVLATAGLDGADPEALAAADTAAAFTPGAVGAYLVLCIGTPWLLWAGDALLRPKGAPRRDTRPLRRLLLCAALTLACFAGGLWLMLHDPALLAAAGL